MHTKLYIHTVVAVWLSLVAQTCAEDVIDHADETILQLLPEGRYVDKIPDNVRKNLKHLSEMGEASYGPLARQLGRTNRGHEVVTICQIFRKATGDTSIPRKALVDFLHKVQPKTDGNEDWDSEGVRYEAIQALLQMATKEEIPTLVEMLDEKNARSQHLALAGLSVLNPVEFVPKIEEWYTRWQLRFSNGEEAWPGEQSMHRQLMERIRNGTQPSFPKNPSILEEPVPEITPTPDYGMWCIVSLIGLIAFVLIRKFVKKTNGPRLMTGRKQ
jgi:hypothetical protein